MGYPVELSLRHARTTDPDSRATCSSEISTQTKVFKMEPENGSGKYVTINKLGVYLFLK